MAVRTRDELLEQIRNRIGDASDDETISFLEDVTDTLDSMDNSSNEDWRTRYEENDASWRRRYTDRFFGRNEDDEDDEQEHENEHEMRTFEDLFS